jgi:hypothetical protein
MTQAERIKKAVGDDLATRPKTGRIPILFTSTKLQDISRT